MAAVPLAPGALFAGDFVIVRPLSSGGMGAIYVAQQQSTGKVRALKLMNADLVLDEGQRARFEQEARVGSMLASDHVVQVIAAGVDEATRMPWMAMEMLEGEDLAACVQRRGFLPPPETYELLRQVCHALGAAHAVGVVHRDVKPENIFLAQAHGVRGPMTVKVLDFGIAKILATSQTSATSALGTPLWMAPEQTESHGAVGPPTDVWALGLLAFWMLTGRHYWLTANESSRSMPQLLREIVMETITKASARAAQLGVAARIPIGFDAWFERCVARDPKARYANAADAIAALSMQVFGGQQVMASATPQWSGPPLATSKPPRRSRRWLVVLLAVTGGIGLVGLLLVYSVDALRARSDPEPPSTASVKPAGVDSASPPVTAATTAAADSAQRAASKVHTSATASPSSPPAPRPFDRAAAEAALEEASKRAAFVCKGKKGPNSVSLKVTFAPSGTVRRALGDPQVMATEAGVCVSGTFLAARVPPFDGADVTVPATAGL